jgi:3-dehydroquinate dehydratase-1
MPKIIVPIVGQTAQAILESAKSLDGVGLDMVEWRADFFDQVLDTQMVLKALQQMRDVLWDTPILFTFRTRKEGGEKEISMEHYTALNQAVARSGLADLIDVEIFSGDEVVRANIQNIHYANTLVIASNHDFTKTPDEDDIIERLRKMQDMGADLLKIAVMPTSAQDVLTLLCATNKMVTRYAKKPVITISMSVKGVISRFSGEVFGSSMTFGSIGKGSAPGQVPVEQLQSVLRILHQSL